jgi:hypothetical protein
VIHNTSYSVAQATAVAKVTRRPLGCCSIIVIGTIVGLVVAAMNAPPSARPPDMPVQFVLPPAPAKPPVEGEQLRGADVQAEPADFGVPTVAPQADAPGGAGETIEEGATRAGADAGDT